MERKPEIQARNGEYGIIDLLTEQEILPFEYDFINQTGDSDSANMSYLLFNSGKFGAFRIDGASGEFQMIAPCEFDSFATDYQDMLFQSDGKIRYYFSTLHSVRDFNYIQIIKHYFFAADDNYYYIFRRYSGETMWMTPICGVSGDLFSIGNPFLAYMGERYYNTPLFFDLTNGGSFAPDTQTDWSIDYDKTRQTPLRLSL